MSLPFHLRRAVDRLGRQTSEAFVRDALGVRTSDPVLIQAGVDYHLRRGVR